ncbi:ribosomal protein L17 [Catenaria anguillulae PL171]|uniref:Ribosomal protein L17 n=1 Tax=Catenaria anguillulae PL171 TaxID=765915 RepID=A0A1Y2HRC9_9FUNG|nr:ribosomal protein L17 [Catenaria anguillulae PL171]
MRHGLAHRKLGRDSAHRRALLRNLVSSLVIHDRIRTTLPKAKEAQALADKMVTLAKAGTPKARKQAEAFLFSHSITLPKLFDTISKRYQTRPGGYTRVIKIGNDPKDSAPMAILEYVDAPGDTKIALAEQQLPRINRSIAALQAKAQEQEQKLASAIPDLVPHRPPHRSTLFSEETLSQLRRKIRSLEKVQSKLTTISQMPFLPPAHEETKFPGKHTEIRVDKKVWTETLPGRGKDGQKRVVVKVKRVTNVVEVDPTVDPKDLKIPALKNKHHAV